MSEQERKKPGPKPKLPKVTVLDRRLRNPFGAPSQAITLKEGGPWEIRWVDAELRPGRLHDMTRNKGWIYITPEELDGTPDEYGLTAKEGRLVRGEHGREVLMKMPKAEYDQIQLAKARFNLKGLGGKATREAVAQETAKKFGDEAGETVLDRIEISDQRGVDSELEADQA